MSKPKIRPTTYGAAAAKLMAELYRLDPALCRRIVRRWQRQLDRHRVAESMRRSENAVQRGVS